MSQAQDGAYSIAAAAAAVSLSVYQKEKNLEEKTCLFCFLLKSSFLLVVFFFLDFISLFTMQAC